MPELTQELKVFDEIRTEACDAFKKAIDNGRLSDNPKANNYAGNYMYMGPGCGRLAGQDAFKNSMTRLYDV